MTVAVSFVFVLPAPIALSTSCANSDDIARLQVLAGELVNGLATNTSDLQLALASFADFPVSISVGRNVGVSALKTSYLA